MTREEQEQELVDAFGPGRVILAADDPPYYPEEVLDWPPFRAYFEDAEDTDHE